MAEIISGERHIALDTIGASAARAASGLLSLGVKRGDLIALYRRDDIVIIEARHTAVP